MSERSHWTRREVLKLLVAAGASIAAMRTTRAAEPLRQRPIPSTGAPLPVVGLGTYSTFDVGGDTAERAAVREVLRLFVEQGGSVIDSSPMYGTAESVTGDIAAALTVRDRLFLATKVWITGEAAGVRQMETSFKRLRTTHVDLMQVHNLLDWRTHLRTLRAWKDEGRIRYIGVTHYTESAYAELEDVMRKERLDFVQINYSLTERAAERRLLPLAQERGMAVLINRPFAKASLFDKVRGRELPPWAADFDCDSWAQYFLKFVLSHPAVTCAIPATRKPKHLLDNMQAGRGRLPEASMRRRMVEHFASL